MSLSSFLMEGVLSKKSSLLFGGWNDHWFRLSGSGLVYYAKARIPGPGDIPSGSVDVRAGKYFRAVCV